MMRPLVSILLLLMFTQAVSFSEEVRLNGKMGYLVDGLNDVKYKDARIAFKLWVSDLAAVHGIEVDINYYENIETISKDYKNFEFDYGVVNGYFFLSHQDIFYKHSIDFWAAQKSNDLFEEYYILVRRDAEIGGIEDLESKTIISRDDDYLGRMVLDYEVLKHKHTSAQKYALSIDKTKKFSTAILQTYFGKVDACVVPSYALNIVGEMNPDILKKLKILHVTEKIFIPIIGFFHENSSQELILRFKKNALRLEKSPRGQNILDLFKMRKMFSFTKEDLKPMLKYYESYMHLQKKYKKGI